MPWVKLDDDYYDHEKFLQAGPLAELLWVRMLAWSHRNLTNGFVPYAKLRQLADFVEDVAEIAHHRGFDADRKDCDPVSWSALEDRLFASGLLDDDPGRGGVHVHDYGVHQETAEEALALREKRREAGRKGGIRSGVVRAGSRIEASGKQVVEQNASKAPSKAPSKTEPEVRSEKLEVTTTPAKAAKPEKVVDEMTARAHALAQIAFEQNLKPITKFLNVRDRCREALAAGWSIEQVEFVIRHGEVKAWTQGAVEMALSKRKEGAEKRRSVPEQFAEHNR